MLCEALPGNGSSSSSSGNLSPPQQPQLHEMSDAQLAEVREAFLRSGAGVLLARSQRPGDGAGLRRAALAVGCGPLVQTSAGPFQQYVATGRRGTPKAKTPYGSDFWHQDNTYLAKPARFTALYATDEVPTDEGDTDFAHLAAAWSGWRLEDAAGREAARGLSAWHCHAHNCGFPHPHYEDGPRLPPQRHALVRRHPKSGRETLLLSPCYLKEAHAEPGTAEAAAAAQLIEDLVRHATSEAYVFSHRWQPGDMLFWDNHLVMHKANTIHMSPDVRRVMFRMSFGD